MVAATAAAAARAVAARAAAARAEAWAEERVVAGACSGSPSHRSRRSTEG